MNVDPNTLPDPTPDTDPGTNDLVPPDDFDPIGTNGWLSAPMMLPSDGGTQTNGQTPQYLMNAEVVPLSGNGTEIAEAITPEIAALARGLENDPVRIFNFVHDKIRFSLYFGSKKGAALTLLERSGNDFDQCSLLVALLRSANCSASYQFGFMSMPYSSPDNRDLIHWFGLDFPNTNWTYTTNTLFYLLARREYPANAIIDVGNGNNMAFHRVWVKATIDGKACYLDPAFKTHELIAGIDLTNAMQLNVNDLLTSAGGTTNADYVQNLSEANIAKKLQGYSSNLLSTIQNSYPNASVDQIIGGWVTSPSTNLTFSQSPPFTEYPY